MRGMRPLQAVPYPVPYDLNVSAEIPGRTPTAPQHPQRGKDQTRNVANGDMAWTNCMSATTNYRKRAAVRSKSVAKTGGIQQGSTTSAVYQAATALRLAVVKALAMGNGQ